MQAGAMEGSADSQGFVTLTLTAAESLVLFEWLHRNEDQDLQLDHLGIVDDAERQVLWSVSGCLESLLSEPFHADYAELLLSARQSLHSSEE
jgi:hypothetical protein